MTKERLFVTFAGAVLFATTLLSGATPVFAGFVPLEISTTVVGTSTLPSAFITHVINSGSVEVATSTGSSAGHGFTAIPAGTYTITETANAGVNLSDFTLTYSGCNSNGQITVPGMPTVFCTVINTYNPQKVTQTINVTTNAPTDASNGSSFPVTATASSGLDVFIAVSGSCTTPDSADGATITMTSDTGTCEIDFTQPGNDSYSAATEVKEFVTAQPALSSDDSVSAFGFGLSGEVDSMTGTDISVTVPNATDVTALTPNITVSAGATVSPDASTPEDFTNPVDYTVTAQDGTTQQTYTVTVTVEAAPAATVTSVDPVSDITVTQGTDLASIGLPTTVTAEMSDGSTQSANVTWDGGSPGYDGNTAASYAFTGTLSGVNNPSNFIANVNVTVKALSTPLLTVSAPSLVYTAAPQDATLHASYAGSTVDGTFSNVEYNGSAIAPTNVGTYAVTADFAPTDTADYSSVTGVSAGDFSITPAPLTITAQTNSKVYDGTRDAAATPLISGLLLADTGSSTEMYDTATVGANKTLNVASYTIQDGNGGNNYSVATVSDTTGVILALTHSLNYSAGANGSITGNTAQTVDDGTDGTMVTAVPDSGFQFSSWNDGVTSASRTDTDVTSDIGVTANFSAIPAPVTSGGGGGGGGGNGPAYGSGTFAPTALPNNGGATTTPGTTGEVLGASAYNFKVDFGIGTQDEDVTQLQLILIAGGYLKIPAPTGYFGVMTKAAVKTYQSAHGITPITGYVGPKTRAALNEGTLPTSPETDSSTMTTIAQLQNQLQILEAEVVAFGK